MKARGRKPIKQSPKRSRPAKKAATGSRVRKSSAASSLLPSKAEVRQSLRELALSRVSRDNQRKRGLEIAMAAGMSRQAAAWLVADLVGPHRRPPIRIIFVPRIR